MPFIGYTNSDRRLTIPVSISNGAEPLRQIWFEIDTASDDYLALPAQVIAELNLEPAGGSDLQHNEASDERPAYIAHIEWHDGPMAVSATETEGPAYVGMGLLWDSLITAYLFEKGVVTVTRLVHWDEVKREMTMTGEG